MLDHQCALWIIYLPMAAGTYKRIYASVSRIPKGYVATYGQIAKLARASGPRQVGYALHQLNKPKVPWHRVINSKGEISLGPETESGEIQRMKLEAEGIEFSSNGKISLHKFRWNPNPKPRSK